MNGRIDLNADLGEGFPWDSLLLDRVSSASVCCGAHAGDSAGITQTLQAARDRGVVVGAHPGYADPDHFGRRELDLTAEAIAQLIQEQVTHLRQLAGSLGIAIRFVKPHGALYNQAQRQETIASGVVAAMKVLALPVLGQPGSILANRAAEAGVPFVSEGFADRRYRSDGSLVPRSEPGAILDDPGEIADQVLRLVEQGIETLCLHGDNPASVELADLIHATLRRAGMTIRAVVVEDDRP